MGSKKTNQNKIARAFCSVCSEFFKCQVSRDTDLLKVPVSRMKRFSRRKHVVLHVYTCYVPCIPELENASLLLPPNHVFPPFNVKTGVLMFENMNEVVKYKQKVEMSYSTCFARIFTLHRQTRRSASNLAKIRQRWWKLNLHTSQTQRNMCVKNGDVK